MGSTLKHVHSQQLFLLGYISSAIPEISCCGPNFFLLVSFVGWTGRCRLFHLVAGRGLRHWLGSASFTVQHTTSYPPLSCDLHTGSGIGASSWFHQSHLLPMLLLPLRHRGCLSDITRALFCSPGTFCDGFLFHPFFCLLFQPAFLHVFCHKMTFYQPGGYDHSVLYTTAQLTEGRFARDQPKQPPAKKASFTVQQRFFATAQTI